MGYTVRARKEPGFGNTQMATEMKPCVGIRLLMSLGLLIGGCCFHSGMTTTTVPEVERRVDTALPAGSTRPQIEAWLTGQGIEYSFSDKPLEAPAVNGPPETDYSSTIVGIIRDTDHSLFVTGSIQLYFLLDANGRLKRRLVKWVGTGP
jgi:hypothetical protein